MDESVFLENLGRRETWDPPDPSALLDPWARMGCQDKRGSGETRETGA